MVEFVSANPTGPLHVGHGRQAALGDAIAALLESQGSQVTREFYYNDAGAQIENLALSVQARAQEPAGRGARGCPRTATTASTSARSRSATSTRSGTTSATSRRSASSRSPRCARSRTRDLQAFGVKFDDYYLESSLYTDGQVDATVQALVASGKTYEQDGALWLRTTDYGDDKDRVMRKSDGSYTYFVPDVAYHVTKWERGFAQGDQRAGHGPPQHGRRACAPGCRRSDIGIPAGYPDYVLHKMVKVMRGGEEVKISKRAGTYVTRARPDRRGGPRRGALLPRLAQGRLRVRVRHRSGAVAVARRTRCTTCSTRTPASAACSRSGGGDAGEPARRSPRST